LNIEDDNLLLKPDYLCRLLETLRQGNPGFSWTGENGLDYSLLSPELLIRLRRLGLSRLNISLGTPEENAGRENRFFDWGAYLGVLRTAQAAGLPVISYFICGLEGDRPENAPRLLARLAGLPTAAGLSLYYPGGEQNPGEESPRLWAGSSAYPWTGSLSTGELLTAFRLARFSRLLKQPLPSPEDRTLRDQILGEKRLWTRIGKGKEKALIPVPALDRKMIALFFENLP
jgi:hypothetical protein